MLLNGLRIRRNHSTRAIEIQSINHNIFTSRIPNYTCHVGDTIIALNGRNVTLMSLAEVNGILRQEVIYQINTISNSTPDNEQIQQSHNNSLEIPRQPSYYNGLEIRRSRNNRGRVEIHSIDNNVLRNLIPNYTCQVGDTLVSLNNVNVFGMPFPEVDSMLRSQQLHSIHSQRGIPSAHALGPETNAARTEIPVLNRSYNQLLQGELLLIYYS